MATDRVEVLADHARTGGRVVALPEWLPDRQAVLLTHPADIRQVLETNQANYRKAAGYREELATVLGSGLLTSEGEVWARQHRLIRPLFTPGSVRSYTPLMESIADALVDRLALADDSIDLLGEMKWATLMIIGRAMFSTDMDAHASEIREALDAMRQAFRARTDPTDALTADTARAALQARGALDEIVFGLIDERRASTTAGPDDLLTRLLAAEDDATGEAMGDQQIRDELMTFLLAGHETTAATLTWTWHCLASNPEIHRMAHEEAVSAASKTGGDPLEFLDSLSYVEQCIREAMRLYPPVPLFSREATTPDSFDGHRIEGGTQVLISQFVTHRDPTHWVDPLVFDPDRFTESDDPNGPYTFFPFGGGPRMCIGRQLAMLEAKLLLGRTLQECRLEHAGTDPESVGVNSAVTMVPDRSLDMSVRQW